LSCSIIFTTVFFLFSSFFFFNDTATPEIYTLSLHDALPISLEGEGSHSSQSFPLKLVEYRGQKVEQFSFTSEGEAREVKRTLRAAAGAGSDGSGELRVIAIDRKQRRRNPAPPFTTSTLQQEAAR